MSLVLSIVLASMLSLYDVAAYADDCSPTFVDCYCESNFENFVQIPVTTSLQKDKTTGSMSCMADEYAPDVCDKRNCSLVPNENFKTLFGNGKKTQKHAALKYEKTHLLKGKKLGVNSTNETAPKRKRSVQHLSNIPLSADYPEEIVLSPNDGVNFNRVKRSHGSCEIPNLQNAEVTCWKWPNWVTCNQVCISGHGLTEGGSTVTKTSMNCRYTENRWKPHPVLDCKPFINCRAHLVSPGDLNCVQMTKEASYCEIRCDEYDDFKETELARYTCDQKFQLPHCAVLDDTVSLINPPSK